MCSTFQKWSKAVFSLGTPLLTSSIAVWSTADDPAWSQSFWPAWGLSNPVHSSWWDCKTSGGNQLSLRCNYDFEIFHEVPDSKSWNGVHFAHVVPQEVAGWYAHNWHRVRVITHRSSSSIFVKPLRHPNIKRMNRQSQNSNDISGVYIKPWWCFRLHDPQEPAIYGIKGIICANKLIDVNQKSVSMFFFDRVTS